MYHAKTTGCGYAHFTSSAEIGVSDRLTVISQLRLALESDQIVVYYQPKMAVGSGELVGIEALARWAHPSRGLLLPEEFVPLAEESTVFQRLTLVVIRASLLLCRGLLDQGIHLPVSVNVSARSLFDPAFSTLVIDRLGEAGVPADLLTIELAEGTVMAYPELTVDVLLHLQSTGIRVAIDDFGTAYASLSYLKKLPVAELKIDRTFIGSLTSDAHDAIIVRSAIELGHSLGLTIVAEGVENETTLAALAELGIDVAQGYYLGEPMPEDRLLDWLNDRYRTQLAN